MEGVLGHCKNLRASGTTQWLKILTTKSDDLGSILTTHVMEKKELILASHFMASACMLEHVHKHTQ